MVVHEPHVLAVKVVEELLRHLPAEPGQAAQHELPLPAAVDPLRHIVADSELALVLLHSLRKPHGARLVVILHASGPNVHEVHPSAGREDEGVGGEWFHHVCVRVQPEPPVELAQQLHFKEGHEEEPIHGAILIAPAQLAAVAEHAGRVPSSLLLQPVRRQILAPNVGEMDAGVDELRDGCHRSAIETRVQDADLVPIVADEVVLKIGQRGHQLPFDARKGVVDVAGDEIHHTAAADRLGSRRRVRAGGKGDRMARFGHLL
mmetsp:Transcript_23227/g.74782  ORF Transcript_23227/g.74782 Transcript_23227/m.74782 type:complete len:261 (+) Transcript_23227:922-1704(+)